MFRVLDARTGELAIALDYYTPQQLEQAFRKPAKAGKLLCPICRSVVALRCDFDSMPHFLHARDSTCPHANENLRLLKLRAALYRQLRREFGHCVTAEHDLPGKAAPRSVDCWVETNGKKFGYWIFDGEIKSAAKRKALRSAIEAEGATCHFVFAQRMLNVSDESTVKLGETEKFAKVCTAYDVLGGKNEGGSVHYINTDSIEPELTTFRTLLAKGDDIFAGTKKHNKLCETEVCAHTGMLVHPGEKTHAEIVRTRKAREQLEQEMEPDHAEAIRRREWEEATRRAPRTNETFAQIMKRLLRPRSDIPSIELFREREAPCEFCGVVTRDWIVYTGKTGFCKCRACYERKSAEVWHERNSGNGDKVA